MSVWKIETVVPQASATAALEALEPHVMSVSALGLDTVGDARIVAFTTTKPDQQALMAALSTAGQSTVSLDVLWLPSTDWLTPNRASFAPLGVGSFFIHDSNFDGELPVNKRIIRIDAATAFGTGAHATTQGCLAVLDSLARIVVPGPVLDVGCGSGILAIAAARALRRPVVATDVDPEAVRTAQQNALRNGVGSWVRTARADGYSYLEIRRAGPYALIFANILSRPLARMAPSLARNLRPGGHAILSGLLSEQEAEVLAPHRGQGLALRGRHLRDGWLTLHLRRRG